MGADGTEKSSQFFTLRVAMVTTPSSTDPNSLSTMNQALCILQKAYNNFPELLTSQYLPSQVHHVLENTFTNSSSCYTSIAPTRLSFPDRMRNCNFCRARINSFPITEMYWVKLGLRTSAIQTLQSAAAAVLQIGWQIFTENTSSTLNNRNYLIIFAKLSP